jgi:hypothetical protein
MEQIGKAWANWLVSPPPTTLYFPGYLKRQSAAEKRKKGRNK